VQIPARARSTARLRRALVAVAVAVVVVVSGRAAAETARALAVSWWTVRAALSAVAVLPCDVDDVPVHRLGVDEHHYRSVRYFQTTDGTWGRLEPVDDHLRVDPDTERALFAVPTHDRREPGWPR